MMSGILGSLLGFGGSAIPGIIDAFKEKGDRKFELEKIKIQADLSSKLSVQQMATFEAQANDKEHERLINHDISIQQSTGFIGALQKSVRPVITYMFFGLFIVIEITLLIEAIKQGSNISESLQILWDDDTKSIFAAIISFWFGSRAIDKRRKA
tara:strand:+ start:1517 stop:1978 length:462 start_codon:yes stop_codon:yes gene_type:complete